MTEKAEYIEGNGKEMLSTCIVDEVITLRRSTWLMVFLILYCLVVEKHDCYNASHCLFEKIISNLGYLLTCFLNDVIYGDNISLCSRKICEDIIIQIHADLVFEKSNLKSSS